MISEKRWMVCQQSEKTAHKLADILNISPVIAQLLLNRDINSLEYAREFLSNKPHETQFDHSLLHRIFTAITDCIKQEKPLFLFGDYDVDGMTSTAMMVRCITALGGVVRYKLPHRFNDGYGLNADIVSRVDKENCGCFITLDCGITNVEEIRLIKEKTKSTVIIIDHHQIPSPQPQADIILNPQQEGTPKAIQQLCTAGIVFKLVSYIADQVSSIDLTEYALLAAIGTVADVVKLQGENRRIVKLGLPLLYKAKNKGILALLKGARWTSKQLSVRDIGFVIAPRLNASGRLSSAEYGVELLLTQDQAMAEKLARYLEDINQERRRLDSSVVDESMHLVHQSDHYKDQSVLVLGKEEWHAGVIGIAASKLVDSFNKPVVVVGIDSTVARGSARSMGGVNIYHMLKKCDHLFLSFGGHHHAAGFSLKPENFELFKTTLESVMQSSISSDLLVDTISIDMKLDPCFISFEFLEMLDCLEPFGHGNPEPLFYTDQLTIIDSRVVGNGKHLKLTVKDLKSNHCFSGIGFNLGNKLEYVYRSTNHLVFSIEKNFWNEKETIQLNIKDIK